jgi:hypothetical protein
VPKVKNDTENFIRNHARDKFILLSTIEHIISPRGTAPGILASYKLPTSHLTRVCEFGFLGITGTPRIQDSGGTRIKKKEESEKRDGRGEKRSAALCDASPTSLEHELVDRGWLVCPPLSDPNRVSY